VALIARRRLSNFVSMKRPGYFPAFFIVRLATQFSVGGPEAAGEYAPRATLRCPHYSDAALR
jgi:hypothetical protein